MGSPIFQHAAGLWAEMRGDYDRHLHAQYERAVNETNACLLNKRGHANRVEELSLFFGPWSRVVAYGSEELLEFFQYHRRMTLAEFERTWWNERMAHEVES